MISYWEKFYWFDNYDAVIVGSGYVGLSTAIHLKEKYPDSRILVLDREAIPTGASTKNAGFACFGSVGEIMDDLKSISDEEVISTIRMRWNGLKYMEKIIDNNTFSIENTGGYEVFRSEEEFISVSQQLQKANVLMHKATGKEEVFEERRLGHTSFYNKAIFNKHEGALNPVVLLKSLIEKAKTLNIHLAYGFTFNSYTSENQIIRMELGNGINIQSRKLIYTNNAFAHSFLPQEEIIPFRNQVIVTKPINDLKVYGTYHFDRGYVYFRNIGNDRLLIGGARNYFLKEETTDKLEVNEQVIDHLLDIARKHLRKDLEIESKWSGIIATGKSKKPIIKEVAQNIYAGVRLGGMGVAVGVQVGKQLSEIIRL